MDTSKENAKYDPLVDKIELTDETQKGIKGLREFIEYWDNDVKPFARKCIQPGLALYVEFSQVVDDRDRFMSSNDIILNPDTSDGAVKYKYANRDEPLKNDDLKVLTAFEKHADKIQQESMVMGIEDFYAIHFISEMMYGVEEFIKQFKNPAVLMINVYGNFTDDEYYKMYKNPEGEEATNYKEFAKKLEHVFTLLKDVK